MSNHRLGALAGLILTASMAPAHGTQPAPAAPAEPASAGSAYRCTAPHGSVSYSQRPCPADAQGQLLHARDERTEAQRQQSQEASRRDKALAHDLDWQSRLRADKAARHKPASLSGPVRQVAVGQREVDRRGAPTEPLQHNPRQFRAKTPHKTAPKAQPGAGGAPAAN